MKRRGFLKILGLGAGTVAAGVTLGMGSHRATGTLVDTVHQLKSHAIPLGSPITVNASVNDLIAAARIRNNNHAIEKILSCVHSNEDLF